MKYYAGIGSRKTPKDVCEFMTKLAIDLEKKGYCLRSGGAEGADQAFEDGAIHAEIYLPWEGFRNKWSKHDSRFIGILPNNNEAADIARQFHPRWRNLTNSAKKFHTRNVYQVLGYDLQTPVSMVICWTEDGKMRGGTAQALRIAKSKNIPIHNLFNHNTDTNFMEEFY